MLYFEKSFVYESLALPCVDVLTDESITNQFKHLADRYRDVVPALLLDDRCERVLADVIINIWSIF